MLQVYKCPILVGSKADQLRDNLLGRNPNDIDLMGDRVWIDRIDYSTIKTSDKIKTRYWLWLKDQTMVEYDSTIVPVWDYLRNAPDTIMDELLGIPVYVIGSGSQYTIKKCWSEYGPLMYRQKHAEDLIKFQNHRTAYHEELYEQLVIELRYKMEQINN